MSNYLEATFYEQMMDYFLGQCESYKGAKYVCSWLIFIPIHDYFQFNNIPQEEETTEFTVELPTDILGQEVSLIKLDIIPDDKSNSVTIREANIGVCEEISE